MPTADPAPLTSPLSMSDWSLANQPAPEQKTDKTWFRNDGISGTNWNRLFPYQLIVVDKVGESTYTRRVAMGKDFQFTLPMPPESFSISMPFAIQSSVTLGGHIEEHNGAPTRMITLAGSMGMFPGRGHGTIAKAFSFRDSVFAGTLNAARATATAAQQIAGQTYVDNTVAPSAFSVVDGGGFGSLTGWFQFRLLQLFFEAYVELKKTKDGRQSRLALATWKDEAVYLVSPINFDVAKDAGSPLEYRYTINLKAYKRVKLDRGVADKAKAYIPIQTDPGKLSKVLNTLSQARLVLQGAKNTILAVGGDVHRTIFEPIRQVTLGIKDTLAVPLTVADLSDSLVQDVKTAVLQISSTRQALRDFGANAKRAGKHVSNNASAINDSIKSLGEEMVDDTRVSPLVDQSRAAHPANTAFDNPSDNFDFFSLVNLSDLNLSTSVQAKIAAERARARNLSRLDYQEMAAGVQATADALSGALNAGHATYNAIYGLEAPATTIIDHPTDEDFNTLFALNQLVLDFSRFAVTTDDDPKLNTIAAVAGLASRSGIAFQQPRSKFAVPFPYGSTLEQLAKRYLNNPDRWLEIATLNGLQSPYVDEEGFTLPLLVNGADNTVFVSSDEHIFVGQPVWIRSDTVVRTSRTITKINELSPTQFMVTVDGDADLDQYVVLGHAVLEAFLPNTVNSQQVIYIPSDLEPKDRDFTTKSIPGIKEYDNFIAVGGIDLLLTPHNDLIITPDGESRWAVGLTNIIQKVRLALSVVQGTLNRHPDYGLPIEVGMSLADLSAAQVVRAAQGMFAGDPTFTGIKAAHIDVQGPLARLNIAVEVAGTDQIIPISAQVAL